VASSVDGFSPWLQAPFYNLRNCTRGYTIPETVMTEWRNWKWHQKWKNGIGSGKIRLFFFKLLTKMLRKTGFYHLKFLTELALATRASHLRRVSSRVPSHKLQVPSRIELLRAGDSSRVPSLKIATRVTTRVRVSSLESTALNLSVSWWKAFIKRTALLKDWLIVSYAGLQ